jgi:hypothetical protein
MAHQKHMKDMRFRIAAAMMIAVLTSLGTANLASASTSNLQRPSPAGK